MGFPVVQAALSGYSDWAMRRIARALGASYTLCEVMLDEVLLRHGKRAKRRLLRVEDDDHPVGGQLMGSQPEGFGKAAGELVAAGFDVIDINFGCPVRKVLGRCRGGFLLGEVTTALEIVARVREAVPPHIPVTAKMRRGLDDSPESREKFFQIFDGAFARGVAAITVHGRTVQQRYDGPSKWDFLREVKQHAGQRTVLGSGDLFSAAACWRMMRETGVDGVTVARGAIGNPWIFTQAQALAARKPPAAPPRLHQQRDVIAQHHQLGASLYGEEQCCRMMRKFGIKYSRLHPQADQVRSAFVAVKQRAEWQAVLARYYRDDLPGCYPDEAADECNLQSCGAPST